MAPSNQRTRRRPGQNSSTFQLPTTPSTGRRVNPRSRTSGSKAPTDDELRRQGFDISDGLPSGRQKPVQPASNSPKPKPTPKPKPKPSPGPTQTALEKRQPASGGGGGSSRPMPSAVTSGSSSSSNRSSTVSASRQTGDKEKDMATWALSNKKLGEALGKRNSERGTYRTSNPLMADFKDSMKRREDAASKDAVSQGKASKAEYNVSKEEGNRRLKPNSTPANSSTRASEQTKDNYSSSSIYDSKVKAPADMSKSKTTNQTSTAFSTGSLNKKSESLAEQIRKRRMGR